MPHDSSGREVQKGDVVLIRAKVLQVYPSETGCNVLVEIDAPEGEPRAQLGQLNTKSLAGAAYCPSASSSVAPAERR